MWFVMMPLLVFTYDSLVRKSSAPQNCGYTASLSVLVVMCTISQTLADI